MTCMKGKMFSQNIGKAENKSLGQEEQKSYAMCMRERVIWH